MSAKRTTGPRVSGAGPRISNAQPAPPPTPVHLGSDRVLVGAREVDITQLTPDTQQPRAHMDAERLAELAGSIVRHGVLQPLIVREDGMAPDGNMRYTIIAGGRRHAAIDLALKATDDEATRDRLARVPIIVSDTAETERRILQLIENIQREDLHPVEEARALKEIQRLEQLTTTQLAMRVHRSQGYIDERLRLLRAPDVEEAVEAGVLTPSAGAAIASIRSAEARRAWIEKARAGETIRPRDVYASKPDRRTRPRTVDVPAQGGTQVAAQGAAPPAVEVETRGAAATADHHARRETATLESSPPSPAQDAPDAPVPERADGDASTTPAASFSTATVRERVAALTALGVAPPPLPPTLMEGSGAGDQAAAARALVPPLSASQRRIVERVLAAGAMLGWSCDEMLRQIHAVT